MAGASLALLPLALLIAGNGQGIDASATSLPPDPSTLDPSTIVFVEHDERMTVPVTIAGAGPYRFIIDTGAERTVISRELASTLRLTAGREVSVIAMTGIARVGTVVIPSLRLSSVPEIGAINAPALDRLNLGGEGLLGIDTLKDHRIDIDFDGATMAVAPSTRTRRTEPRRNGEIVIRAKSTLGQLIVTDAEFEGRPIRVVIDTGSAVSVGNMALRRMVARAASKMKPVILTSVTGGTIATDYAQVDKVRVGGVEFVGLPIAFADVPPFARFGLIKRPALLLGMDALKFFRRVAIDFPNREVRFQMPRTDRVASRCISFVNGRCVA